MRGFVRRRGLDVLAVAWTLAWVGLGWLVYSQVLRLQDLSDSVVVAGRQLHQTAETLRSFGDIPFVGDEVDDIARSAQTAADSARKSGIESRDAVHDVALLLAISVSVIAIAPALLGWALVRFGDRVRAP